MKIDREIHQGELDDAIKRVDFCLNQVEKAESFNEEIEWDTEIVTRLTVEEIIGALVIAEQKLKDFEQLSKKNNKKSQKKK